MIIVSQFNATYENRDVDTHLVCKILKTTEALQYMTRRSSSRIPSRQMGNRQDRTRSRR